MMLKYTIDSTEVELSIEGKTSKGLDHVLIHTETNLLSNTAFADAGFALMPFLSEHDFKLVEKGVELLVKNVLEKLLNRSIPNFTLAEYHRFVNDEEHLAIASHINKGFHIRDFPISYDKLEERVSAILKRKVRSLAKHIKSKELFSQAAKPDGAIQIFHIRIVRPNKFTDNNPPHKDVWIEHLKNAVNLYVPICGSNQNSSLPLVPGSHLFAESRIERLEKGGRVNGVSFTVPCVLSVDDKPLKLVRPNPQYNEMLIFSPYLIHGGASNFQQNQTRVSLEMRFWEVA